MCGGRLQGRPLPFGVRPQAETCMKSGAVSNFIQTPPVNERIH
jgi:hypothetical protein